MPFIGACARVNTPTASAWVVTCNADKCTKNHNVLFHCFAIIILNMKNHNVKHNACTVFYKKSRNKKILKSTDGRMHGGTG